MAWDLGWPYRTSTPTREHVPSELAPEHRQQITLFVPSPFTASWPNPELCWELRGSSGNRGGLGASGMMLCWSWDPGLGRNVTPKEWLECLSKLVSTPKRTYWHPVAEEESIVRLRTFVYDAERTGYCLRSQRIKTGFRSRSTWSIQSRLCTRLDESACANLHACAWTLVCLYGYTFT